MVDKRDIRRRALGAFFLVASLVMLIAGETLLNDHLRSHPAEFLIYWMMCFVCVGLAFLMALLDLAVVRGRTRQQQRELLETAMRQIAQTKELKAKGPPEPPENSK
jgi:protein-S-isoprenylcysteine O-methyltransferase Ste14